MTDETGVNTLNELVAVEYGPDGKLKLRSDGTLSALYAKPTSGISATHITASVQR